MAKKGDGKQKSRVKTVPLVGVPTREMIPDAATKAVVTAEVETAPVDGATSAPMGAEIEADPPPPAIRLQPPTRERLSGQSLKDRQRAERRETRRKERGY